MKKLRLPLILCGILLLVSCSARRDLLSDIIGIPVTRKCNLELYDAIATWWRVPYVLGGETKNGVDCSGFVKAIYKEVYDITLERTCEQIAEKNVTKIIKKGRRLKEGDLVFFNTSSKVRYSHIGIYLKDGYFVHASSTGIKLASLETPYWKERWLNGGRIKKRTK